MRKEDAETIRGDWQRVGNGLRAALFETAARHGGEALKMVSELAGDDSELLPDPAALRYLSEQYPGSAEAVMDRTEEIQKERHASERGNATKQKKIRTLFERLRRKGKEV